jgi:hypothetical protein
MGREVTVVGQEGGVQLGILDETGRAYHYIRIIHGALAGSLEASQVTTKMSKGAVEIIDGFRFDLLAEHVTRAQETLLWQTRRQEAISEIHARADRNRTKFVQHGIHQWERDNPVPGGIVDETTARDPEPEADTDSAGPWDVGDSVILLSTGEQGQITGADGDEYDVSFAAAGSTDHYPGRYFSSQLKSVSA